MKRIRFFALFLATVLGLLGCGENIENVEVLDELVPVAYVGEDFPLEGIAYSVPDNWAVAEAGGNLVLSNQASLLEQYTSDDFDVQNLFFPSQLPESGQYLLHVVLAPGGSDDPNTTINMVGVSNLIASRFEFQLDEEQGEEVRLAGNPAIRFSYDLEANGNHFGIYFVGVDKREAGVLAFVIAFTVLGESDSTAEIANAIAHHAAE